MATSNVFSQPFSSSPDDYFIQLEVKINSHFNNLSDLLNQRRSKILQQLSALKSAFYEAEILRNQSIKDLQTMKDGIIKPDIKSNDMVAMTEHILKTMDDKMQSLKDPTPLPIIAFADDLELSKDSLSRCELVTMNHDWKSKNTPLVVVTQENTKLVHTHNTNKKTINTPVKKATTNKDMRLGALAYDERRKLIYAFDAANSVCKVYDMDGKLISEFKIKESTDIYCLALNKDCSYLYAVNSECEVNPNTVYQINANDYAIMNKSKNKMEDITCVDTDSMGDVYVGGINPVLYILSAELVIKKELFMLYISCIVAIKCLPDSIIVLSIIPYQLSSFSYTGELQRVLRTEKIDLNAAEKDKSNTSPCIAIDSGGLLIYSDILSHVVQIISPNGYLIHQIGSEGKQKGQFLFPTGVAVTEKGLLIVTSNNSKYPLQIF